MITLGNPNAPYYVVCEPPKAKYNPSNPTSADSLRLFIDGLRDVGFNPNDFFFIQLCEPIPENIKKSDSKKWKFVAEYLEFLNSYLQGVEKPIITMGDLATRAVMGRKHAIMKCRGTVLEGPNGPVFPILSPAQVLRVLENMPIFKADLSTLKIVADNGFKTEGLGGEKNSYWCYDLQFLIDNKPKVIAADTETTGLRTTEPNFQVLTVQIAYNETDCAVVPLHPNFFTDPEHPYSPELRDKLLSQLKIILEDKSIRKIGHNINYDRAAIKTLGIVSAGWICDNQLLAATIDENMYSKSLDDCARRFLPDEAGYNDFYNSEIDKADMINCPPDYMLEYGGGDSRVSLKLFNKLWKMLLQNPLEYRLFIKLKMPGLLAFQMMEEEGITIDIEYLNSIKTEAKAALDELHEKLINMAPKSVLRKHVDDFTVKKKIHKENPLRLSRDSLVRDILFSKDGFNLKPIVFTETTKDDPDPKNRVPSVSSKQHLPFFTDIDGPAGDFVTDLIEYVKLEKLNSTYIQKFEENYVHSDGKIHPSFLLHRTNTSRSSSANPNAQNFPSRGPWAKKYKKIFVSKPGYKFISADLSQIELRLIAWESQDPVMLEAYRTGKDIHKITAMAVSGHTDETWNKLSKDEQKLLRYRAKAVNFGFCYGMRAKKFQRYAKTDYGIDLTQEEAQAYYNTYHRLYRNIKKWHSKRAAEAHTHGYVTSLHGFRRNLPSIFSQEDSIRMGAERNAINSPIQGFGSDLGVLAIARIARQVDPEIICPVAFIHDDIILQVKDGYEQEAVDMLLAVLNNPPLKELFNIESPVPILAEPDIGLSLGSMMELYELPEDAPSWATDIRVDPKLPEWWKEEKDIKA